jgi:transketolase
MKVDMDPTRMGFGRGLEIAGEDSRVVTLDADISGSIRITDFEAKHPERKNRVFSVGIAEQNMMSVAAGLAREGFIPVTGTYGVFASGRAWDQLRTIHPRICEKNFLHAATNSEPIAIISPLNSVLSAALSGAR